LSYLLVPFQGYAALKGFTEKEEGPWFRTPKTGRITDIFTPGRFARFISGLFGRPAAGKLSNTASYDGFNPYLALNTSNNHFNHFRLRKKVIKGFAETIIVFLLLISMTISYLAQTITLTKQERLNGSRQVFGIGPGVKQAHAQTPGGIQLNQYGPKTNPADFYLENPSNPGVYDTPYIFRQVDVNHYQVDMKSKNGIMRYDFDQNGIHLSENKGAGFVELISGSWFRFQYFQAGAWQNATYNLSTLQMGKNEPGDGTITVWIQANFNEAPAAYGRMEMKLGFNGSQEHFRKITVYQPDIWSGALLRRTYWDVSVSQDLANAIAATTNDYLENGLRPKIIRLADAFFNWQEITDFDPRIALDKENRRARIWFYENGLTGDLVIDPTMSTTVSDTTITITGNRYKAVVDNDGAEGIIEYYNPANGAQNWIDRSGNGDNNWFDNVVYDPNATQRLYSGLDAGTRGTDWDVELLEVNDTRVVIRRWGSWDYFTDMGDWRSEDYFVFYPEYFLFTWKVWRNSGTTRIARWELRASSPNVSGTKQYSVTGGTWTNSPTNSFVDLNRQDTYSNYRDDSTSPTIHFGLVHKDNVGGPQVDNHAGSYYGRWPWLQTLSSPFQPGTGETNAWALMVIDDADQSSELAGVNSDYSNPDDLTDGLVTGSGWFDADENTVSSTDFYNQSELTYNLDASSSNVEFDLDGGTNTRYQPVFKIRAYRDEAEPSSVTVEGTAKSSGTDYNTDIANFSEAWAYDGDGTCGTGGYKRLANGGDTGDAAEYLNDDTLDFDFGEATCTIGDNVTATDYFYIGSHDQFTGVNLDLATVGVGDASITWEYCSANTDVMTACDTWSTLTMTDTDTNAQHLRSSGNFYFTDPASWVKSNVNSGRSLWWIRGSVSSGSYATYPVENTIRTDILIFQYFTNISSDDQTFIITPEGITIWLGVLAMGFPFLIKRISQDRKKKRLLKKRFPESKMREVRKRGP
ncbi:hypothetical protein HY439_03745, partial [Candidatus Microgenomates bacterium]|nr:hypothetical protein [Candidatus Microgenomates bacterium]